MSKTRHGEVKEPLIHLSKRTSIKPLQAWAIRLAAIALGMIVCGLVAFVLIDKLNQHPERIGDFYGAFIKGSFSTSRKFWKFLKNIAILLCISLALTPAFRMRFWNIGGEGQTLVSVLAAIAVAFYVGGTIPEWVLLILMLLAALAAGAIWALVPAFFKAHWNTNETLFTLMMNYIAMQIVSYFVYRWSVPKGSGHIGVINGDTMHGWLPKIGEYDYLLNILIVLVLTGIMFVYLKYSKHGYELTVVGESENTARYIGVNVKKVILRTMILSGAICGLIGFLIVGGTDHTVASNSARNRGFTAIMISWLAHFNPLYMIVTSLLIAFMARGAKEMASMLRMNEAFADILVGIIIFCIIGSEFFLNYRVVFRHAGKEKTKLL